MCVADVRREPRLVTAAESSRLLVVVVVRRGSGVAARRCRRGRACQLAGASGQLEGRGETLVAQP